MLVSALIIVVIMIFLIKGMCNILVESPLVSGRAERKHFTLSIKSGVTYAIGERGVL
jgi:hypothetical protein